VFCATVNVNVSPLAPVAGATVNHVASLDADHDTWFVVTVTVVESAAKPAAQEPSDTDTSGSGGGAASWDTDTVADAVPAVTVTVAVLAAPVF
jgi:hypothetical protein